MAIMTAGGVAVAALVVWSLTRTVQPVPEASANVPMGVEQTTAGTTAPNPALPVPEGTAASTATYTPNPPTEDENASVPRISVADLRSKIDAKQVTVIDVRQDTAYMTAHIPGALHIAMTTVESQVASIPKDKPIVTYCT